MPTSFLTLSNLHPLTTLLPHHPLPLTLSPCTLPPILFLLSLLPRHILKRPSLGQEVNKPTNRKRSRSYNKITVT